MSSTARQLFLKPNAANAPNWFTQLVLGDAENVQADLKDEELMLLVLLHHWRSKLSGSAQFRPNPAAEAVKNIDLKTVDHFVCQRSVFIPKA